MLYLSFFIGLSVFILMSKVMLTRFITVIKKVCTWCHIYCSVIRQGSGPPVTFLYLVKN